jgi:tRNA (cytidine/uridine-2'-O-)-methyltransferase
VKVVLVHPQIPQNTGNIVRTCAVIGCDLIIVKPTGFPISDRQLRRAGLDYWEDVNIEFVDDLEKLLETTTSPFYFFSSKATTYYSDVAYTTDSLLIFGSETSGLPGFCLERWPDRFVTLPMQRGLRCLNLATSVGIGVYEAWRQQKFGSLK